MLAFTKQKIIFWDKLRATTISALFNNKMKKNN